MSHPAQMAFVRMATTAVRSRVLGARVLEIGSLDINGSVRPFFKGASDYIGIDLGAGPGVDAVCRGEEFADPDHSYDIVVTCECLEHNHAWAETLQNAVRLLRPGGLLILTCATTGRPEHGTRRTSPIDSPFTSASDNDYYQNLRKVDLLAVTPIAELAYSCFAESHSAQDLYMVGQVAGGRPLSVKQRIGLSLIKARFGIANFGYRLTCGSMRS